MMRKLFSGGRKVVSMMRPGATVIAVCVTALCLTARANQDVSLAWDPDPGTNVMGYYLYYGTSATNLSSKIDVGNNTMATITGLTGKSAKYYFSATAYSTSRMESPPSNQALFTTSSNGGPSLASLASMNGNVSALFVITNKVTDSDSAPHTVAFSLGAGAPPNMRINTNTGRLMWVPTLDWGGTTNQITVRVTDNFGLYSTQTFYVGVSNATQITLSPVVVGLGNTGSMQVTLACSTPVTNVSFVLDAPSNRVSNVTVQNLVPGSATITQQTAGAAHSTITIKALAGQSLSGTNVVAQVNFVATTNLPSAFAWNNATAVTAVTANGQNVPKTFGSGGELVLVGAEPLVKSAVQTNGQSCLTLYGTSGKSFQIQSSTNPMTSGTWSAYLTSGVLGTNLTQTFSNVPAAGSLKYFRILAL